MAMPADIHNIAGDVQRLLVLGHELLVSINQMLAVNQELLAFSKESLTTEKGILETNKELLATNRELLACNKDALKEVKLIRANSDKMISVFVTEITGTEVSHGVPVSNLQEKSSG